MYFFIILYLFIILFFFSFSPKLGIVICNIPSPKGCILVDLIKFVFFSFMNEFSCIIMLYNYSIDNAI